jgi:hypothetical protein
VEPDLILKDRICDASDRIPTARWPLFSTTEDETIVATDTSTDIVLEAERDLLLTDMSISVTAITGGAALEATVTIDYCNTLIVDATDVLEWGYCCGRKPIFLMGIRENKRLRVTVTLAAAAPVGGAAVSVSFSGFQGNGCCS